MIIIPQLKQLYRQIIPINLYTSLLCTIQINFICESSEIKSVKIMFFLITCNY